MLIFLIKNKLYLIFLKMWAGSTFRFLPTLTIPHTPRYNFGNKSPSTLKTGLTSPKIQPIRQKIYLNWNYLFYDSLGLLAKLYLKVNCPKGLNSRLIPNRWVSKSSLKAKLEIFAHSLHLGIAVTQLWTAPWDVTIWPKAAANLFISEMGKMTEGIELGRKAF